MSTTFYTLDELVLLHQKGQLRTTKVNFEQVNANTKQNASQYRDVHVYDHKQSLPADLTKLCFPPDVKQKLIEKLLLILENPVSIMMARKIMHEKIFDPVNNIQTDDLLAGILIQKMSIDIFLLLEEQLCDNFLLGQCPQGRSHRLLQIYRMLVE